MKNLHDAIGGLPVPPAVARVAEALNQTSGMCEEHGRYIVSECVGGAWFARNPRGCPHCAARSDAEGLMSGCNMPKRFAEATFANFHADTPEKLYVLKACQDYAANFRKYRNLGRGLILSGDVGTGKNHLAAALFKDLLAQRFTALRVKATEFLDAYWAKSFDERDGWIRSMGRVDLLLIDEVGRSSETANAQNAFFRLIDARYENTLPTMITTNCGRAELIAAISDAAYDRLTQGGTKRYTMKWDSYRAKAHEATT